MIYYISLWQWYMYRYIYTCIDMSQWYIVYIYIYSIDMYVCMDTHIDMSQGYMFRYTYRCMHIYKIDVCIDMCIEIYV